MQLLTELENGDALTAKFFPGHTGTFFGAEKGGENAPIFGVIQDAKDPGKVFITGAGGQRSWSETIPLEKAGMKIVRLKPLSVHIGDVRKDGTADLVFGLAITSGDAEGTLKQQRTAIYMFELAKQARLVWYQTLDLVGKLEKKCESATLKYKARVSYEMTDEGLLEGITVDSLSQGKKCTQGDGCDQKEHCDKSRDESRIQLKWDEGFKTFGKEGATESVVRIPDVTL